MSINGQTDKEIVMDNNGILTSHKKEWNLAICVQHMARSWGHYAKWIKSNRVRQIPHDLSNMWNLKKWYNELTCKTEIESQM